MLFCSVLNAASQAVVAVVNSPSASCTASSSVFIAAYPCGIPSISFSAFSISSISFIAASTWVILGLLLIVVAGSSNKCCKYFFFTSVELQILENISLISCTDGAAFPDCVSFKKYSKNLTNKH